MPIEKLSPELDRIISSGEDIEVLGQGYGPHDPTVDSRKFDIHPCAEGPVWMHEQGCLVFTDITNNRRMKWSPREGVTLHDEPSEYANGLTRDQQGRIVACEQYLRRVARLEPEGTKTVIASRYRGVRFNRPNDVVVKSDGSIYFTDPGAPRPGCDLDFAGVYRVSPDLGEVTLLVKDFVTPNGLTFSPDEKILYVDDTLRHHIRAFDVQANGMLNLHSDRVFCDMRGERPGMPDGLKVDVEGNVYCTGSGGVWIIDPSGKHLGTVLTEEVQTTNCAFGGDDWRTLFYTTFDVLGSIRVNIPGVPVPSPKPA